MIELETALQRLDGDLALYQELLTLFLDDTPIQLETLEQGLEGGNVELVSRQAHSLKSASGSIGADVLCRTAASCEMISKSGNLAEARELFMKLSAEFEKFKSFVSSDEFLSLLKRHSTR